MLRKQGKSRCQLASVRLAAALFASQKASIHPSPSRCPFCVAGMDVLSNLPLASQEQGSQSSRKAFGSSLTSTSPQLFFCIAKSTSYLRMMSFSLAILPFFCYNKTKKGGNNYGKIRMESKNS